MDQRFLQDRLALFGKTVFWIAGTFIALSLMFGVIRGQWDSDPGRQSHIAATLIAFVVWRLSRRSTTLPRPVLWVLDGAGTLGMCVCLAVMGYYGTGDRSWSFFASTLAVLHITLARAVVVPSSAQRTFVVTALSFAPLIVTAQYLPHAEGSWSSVGRWIALVMPFAWSSSATALATLASNVVYGLRAEVVKARQLGQYTLESKIGAGGMGEVYRASHALLRRPTAIKLLAGEVSPEQVRRFEQEVQLTASLTHPNTISIYDFGRTPDGTFYYVMELLDGLTLQQVVERGGPQPPGRVVHILLQVCAALQEAHDAGLIHRDIKPANIFLCRLGGVADVVKVLDFGLVKQIKTSTELELSHSAHNAIVGTPLYLSPEAITAVERLDGRSDLYALGAVGYFLLTGEPPFCARTIVEVCSMHLHSAPVSVTERAPGGVPPELASAIHACLAKAPADRPRDAAELAARLRACAADAAWTDADARTWWREHPACAVQAPLSPPNSTIGGTIQVDLETRLAPPRAAS